MWYLRQNTASQVIPLGPFIDPADGNSEKSGLTINNTDILLLKAGAITEVAKNSGGATALSGGRYYATLDATDTNTIGNLRVYVHVTGAMAVWLDCVVLAQAVYDVMFGTVAPSTYAGGAVASVTGNVGGNVSGTVASVVGSVGSVTNPVTVGTNNDKTGYSLAVAPPTAVQIRQEMDANSTKLDVNVGSRLAASSYIVAPTVTAIRTEMDTNSVKLDVAVSSRSTLTSAMVWDQTTAGHTTGGSFGAAVVAAGSAGDPWSTLLPGSYGAGTAGAILGSRLDAAVSSRLASASYAPAPTVVAIRTEMDTNSVKLDANVGSRSTYAGSDTPGTTTLLSRLSAPRAGYLDNLSAGPVAQQNVMPPWYTPSVDVSASVAAIKAQTDNLPADPAGMAALATAHGTGSWTTPTSMAVSDKTGFSLASTGLDSVLVSGKTLPYAIGYIAAAACGKVTGAGSGVESFYGMDGVLVLTITVDENGNRSGVVYG